MAAPYDEHHGAGWTHSGQLVVVDMHALARARTPQEATDLVVHSEQVWLLLSLALYKQSLLYQA